jgi:hypothetical protein
LEIFFQKSLSGSIGLLMAGSPYYALAGMTGVSLSVSRMRSTISWPPLRSSGRFALRAARNSHIDIMFYSVSLTTHTP